MTTLLCHLTMQMLPTTWLPPMPPQQLLLMAKLLTFRALVGLSFV